MRSARSALCLPQSVAGLYAGPETKDESVFPSAATLAFAILLWVAIATVQISAGFYSQDRLGLDSDAAARMLSLALTLVGTAMFAVQFLQDRMLRFAPHILILAGAAGWNVGLLLQLSTSIAPTPPIQGKAMSNQFQ